MKTADNRGKKLTDGKESGSERGFVYAGKMLVWALIVTAGQLIVSFGDKLLHGFHMLVGGGMAIAGGLLIAVSSRRDFAAGWGIEDSSSRRMRSLGIISLVLLISASLLNFHFNKIGYAEDEYAEFCHLSLPMLDHGLRWWAGIDEMLTANITAIVCYFLPIRFETIKFVAFIFRTGAGVFLWLLAMELFGKRIAFWTSIIFASSVMYMCSFDTVLKESSSHLCFLACIFFTLRGIRTGTRLNLLLGGIFSGLIWYTYVTKYAMCGVLAFGFTYLYFFGDPKYPLFPLKKRWLWWLIPAMLFSVPFVCYTLLYPSNALDVGHIRINSTVNIPVIIKDLWAEFFAITYKGDPWSTSNYAGKPMLWVLWGIFFWPGFMSMLINLRSVRNWMPLLMMAAFIVPAGLYIDYTPNWKYSRTAMLLSVIPAAVAFDMLYGRLLLLGRKYVPVLAVVLACSASFVYGWQNLKSVMQNATSWWFRAVAAVKMREDFVYHNPQYRFFGVGAGCYVTDPRIGGPVSPVRSVRSLLETPGDGRDVVFLFPVGRSEWGQKLNSLLQIFNQIYPGGTPDCKTVQVEQGMFPVILDYRIPASAYWYLPEIHQKMDNEARASLWWKRANMLKNHGLILEAWRDALQAARIDTNYYQKADQLLGNDRGNLGRLSVLIKGRLWEEARKELDYWRNMPGFSPVEKSWHEFLVNHGLEVSTYEQHTFSGPPTAHFRSYFSSINVGFGMWYSATYGLKFRAKAEGQLFVPRDGNYNFAFSACDLPRLIMIDGQKVLETSRYHFSQGPGIPVFLKRGLHSFVVDSSPFYRFEGSCSMPTLLADPLNYLYGADDSYWPVKWQFENGAWTSIPSEYLYAPGAKETPLPMQL